MPVLFLGSRPSKNRVSEASSRDRAALPRPRAAAHRVVRLAVHTLLLFDIDGTLISTHRSGMLALGDAGRAVFGENFDHECVEYSGRLDPLIIHDLIAANGHEPSRENFERLRDSYRGALGARLAANAIHARALPGVLAWIDHIEGRVRGGAPIIPGLLTGNYEVTGSMKLRACGVEPTRFSVRVWGDESPHHPPERRHLPPIGIRRAGELVGRTVEPGRTVVIGDTPHDIDCAHAHGCRCIAVATGLFTRADLERAGADLVVDTLEDAEGLTAWAVGER